MRRRVGTRWCRAVRFCPWPTSFDTRADKWDRIGANYRILTDHAIGSRPMSVDHGEFIAVLFVNKCSACLADAVQVRVRSVDQIVAGYGW